MCVPVCIGGLFVLCLDNLSGSAKESLAPILARANEHAPSSDVYIRNHQGHLLSLISKEAVLALKFAPH